MVLGLALSSLAAGRSAFDHSLSIIDLFFYNLVRGLGRALFPLPFQYLCDYCRAQILSSFPSPFLIKLIAALRSLSFCFITHILI